MIPNSYTYLELTEFVYIRLKGLIWVCNGLVNPNKIEKDTADGILQIYKTVHIDKPIVIDCKGVFSVTDHSWDDLFKGIAVLKREIIFLNSISLDQEISNRKKEFCNQLKKHEADDNKFISIYDRVPFFDFQDKHVSEIAKLLDKMIIQFVEKSYCPFNEKKQELKYLKSTPFLASGEFNASSIISNPTYFYWTCIALTDKVEKIVQDFKIGSIGKKPRILSVSLRSSPFANIIGLFLGYYLETIDHFGPINKFFELENLNNSGVEYIYIGDFTFGGTEIKISKNYAQWNNAKLEHAVVIGSLFESTVYSDFNLHPLTNLKGVSNAIHKLFND